MEDELLPAHSRRRLFPWTAKNQLPIHAQLHHSRWYPDSCILGDYHNGKSISISKPLKTDSNFSHLIHVKPHTTDYLRTWVSLSHQTNMLLFLFLVLQFGNLPRVVIKEEGKKKSQKWNKKNLEMQQMAFSFSHALQKGQEALRNISLGILLTYFYHLVMSCSWDKKKCWQSNELAFLLIILKSFFLVHLFSTLDPLGLSVIKEKGGADE